MVSYIKIFLFLFVILLLSCSQAGKKIETNPSTIQQVEVHGRVVLCDSLEKPNIISAGLPKLAKAIISSEVEVRNLIKPALDPIKVLAGKPIICTPGQNGYQIPKEIITKGVTKLSGIPQIVAVKEPYNKNNNPQSFASYGTIQGLKYNNIRCLIQDRNGNLWFSNDDGVTRFDGKYLTHFTAKNGLGSNIVLSMIEDRHGTLWFGTFGGGVTRYDGEYFTRFTENEGLCNNIVNRIVQDHTGNIWFATEGGVSMYNGKGFTNYTVKQGLPIDQIRSVCQDKDGAMWFGTFGKGLSKFNGESFENYDVNEGFAGKDIGAIIQDKDGNIWFGSNNKGIIKYDGKYFLGSVRATLRNWGFTRKSTASSRAIRKASASTPAKIP